jgi:hypothetical protein
MSIPPLLPIPAFPVTALAGVVAVTLTPLRLPLCDDDEWIAGSDLTGVHGSRTRPSGTIVVIAVGILSYLARVNGPLRVVLEIRQCRSAAAPVPLECGILVHLVGEMIGLPVMERERRIGATGQRPGGWGICGDGLCPPVFDLAQGCVFGASRECSLEQRTFCR